MGDMRRSLRLPTISCPKSGEFSAEPSSPDSGFSSDDSTSGSSPPLVRQHSDRLRSALRRLPSDCRKKVRFGDAVVVQWDRDDDEVPFVHNATSSKTSITFPNFTFRPESDYWKRARSQGVCVSAFYTVGSSFLIQLAVHNRAFNKEVFVQWSTDCWKKSLNQLAIYSHSAAPDIDIFTASIALKIQSKKAELCICYKVNGAEYWDNNDGQNYLVLFSN